MFAVSRPCSCLWANSRCHHLNRPKNFDLTVRICKKLEVEQSLSTARGTGLATREDTVDGPVQSNSERSLQKTHNGNDSANNSNEESLGSTDSNPILMANAYV